MSAARAQTVAAPPRSAAGLRRRTPLRSVSFPELVWAHFLRQKALDEGHVYEGEAEERYREFERAFETRHGPIVSAYWCSHQASAVALTVRTRPGMLADAIRLHWATDWATKEAPGLTQVLYRCESLAVQAGEILRDTSKRVAMHRLFNTVAYMLAFAESPAAKDEAAVQKVVESQAKPLDDLQKYYRNAAGRSGQIVYLAGALLGVLPLIVLALVAALFGAFDAGKEAVRTGAVCFAAGGVGALVSVMSRMNSARVGVDWEFGKDTLRTLGSLRPFVGAIFGLMTYFALKSGLVSLDLGSGSQNFYFFVLFSFAAGFSERLAQDMLLGTTVGRLVSRPEEPEPPPEPTPAPTAMEGQQQAEAGTSTDSNSSDR
jgi:hypothetical protein